MTHYNSGLDAHHLLKLARVATRSNLFILTSGYYKTLWTTSKDTEESYMAFRKSKG
jgi:hypothetical protein